MKNKNRSIKGALAALSLSILLAALGTSIANIALPTFSQHFDAPFQAVQWVVLAYLLSVTALVVIAGKLGDVIGYKRLLVMGVMLFIGASILAGLAQTLWVLIIARAVQGVGAAAMMALSMALISDTVPKHKTGSAMGLLGTMSAIGTALGPSLGGFLISVLGWRAIFFVNIPIGLAVLFFALRYLPATNQASKKRQINFDRIGTLLLVLTLAAYTLAMTVGHGKFGFVNIVLLLSALLSAGLFVITELKVSEPLIRLSIFRERVISTGVAVNVLVMSVMMATLIVGPFYLSEALGLNVAKVGLVVSVGPIAAALVGVPAGRLVDRFGSSRITVGGILGLMAGSLMLAVFPATFGVIGYLLPIILITSSFALFQAANNTAVMSSTEHKQRGVVSGVLNLSRNLGLITGTAVMGAIFAYASRISDLTSAHANNVAMGMRFTFMIATALALVSLIIMVSSNVHKVRIKRREQIADMDDSLLTKLRFAMSHWRCLLGYC